MSFDSTMRQRQEQQAAEDREMAWRKWTGSEWVLNILRTKGGQAGKTLTEEEILTWHQRVCQPTADSNSLSR